MNGLIDFLVRHGIHDLTFDPMYQPTMDESYHQFLQPKWDKQRAWWIKQQKLKEEHHR